MSYTWSRWGGVPRQGEGEMLTPGRLREEWRARSLRAGWSMPEDWWSPAVESVVDAICAGRGLPRACARLGAARGRAGVGIGETLDDLAALFSVLRWPDPPLSLVRCAAEGWVDSGLLALAVDACEDPLTGLVTVSYLRCRLGEVYRGAAAADARAADSHCLVVVDLSDGSPPWRRLARAVVVAHDLRTEFAGGETLTLIGAGRAAALVETAPDLPERLGLLHGALTRSLAGDRGLGAHDVLVWIEPLPGSLHEAFALLDGLTR